MSSPGNSRAGTPSQQRKRSFGSSHLDGAATGRVDVKSQRSTPSPWDTSAATPQTNFTDEDPFGNVIDLTGDDDVFWTSIRKKQADEAERLRRNKALADSDGAYAKQLSRSVSGSGWPQAQNASFGQPSRLTNNNAFDRIIGRSQSSQQPSYLGVPSIKPDHGLANASGRPRRHLDARDQKAYLPGHTHTTVHTTQSLVKSEPTNGHPMRADAKPEPSNGYSFSSSANIKAEPPKKFILPGLPGSFVDSDDDSEGGGSYHSSVSRHHSGGTPRPAPPSNMTLPQRPAGLGSNEASQYPVGVPSLDLARQSALAGQASGYPYTMSSVPYGHYGNSIDLTSPFPSHGYQSTSSIHRPGYVHNGNYYGQPPLGTTINHVKGFDFDTMLDAHGNPLNPRLHSVIHDYLEDPRKTEEEIQELLSNIRPDMDIPVEERGETPEALRYSLYVHQQLALKWMVTMEEGTNKGGILADDMGLGKTISTLALMVTQKASSGVKTNLIIGPVALIKQWELEIKKKLKPSHKLSVYLLHQRKKVTYQHLKNYDVVLTTYGSVASEWRQYNQHVDQRIGSIGYDPLKDEELQRKCPVVHPRNKFHRIILDEAQCIKNKDTQSSRGVHQIEATYRWCLTGTPMMNGVSELYPLIRFLRIKPYCDVKQFSQAFKSLTSKTKSADYQRDGAMKKLQAVLKATMLRRMKSSEIDGKPILVLPPKTELEDYVVFSEDELSFYKDLEARSQVQLNKYLRAGTVGKNYSNILVLLLRLRQACCHPHLMDFECVAANDVSEDQMLNLAKSLELCVVDRIKSIEAFECPICYDAVEDPTLIVPCGHDTCSECFASLTDSAAQGNIRSGNENVSAKCPVCRGGVESSKVISYTAFQKVHMPERVRDEASNGVGDLAESSTDDEPDADSDSGFDDDDDDASSIGSLKDFIVDDDSIDDDVEEEDVKDDDTKDNIKNDFKAENDIDEEVEIDAEIDAKLAAVVNLKNEKKAKEKKVKKEKKKQTKLTKLMKPKTEKKAGKKGKGKAEKVEPHMLGTLRHEASKNKEARRRYMHYLRDNWEDSAKVTQVIELLKQIQETDEKTIIFSQWTSLLDLIESQVRYKLGIKYCRYTGGMSRPQRDEAVVDFVENPRNKVMLVSLRAGNAGLNLTVASRVIICDPFWNPYIEMQAVDRAHRIGQQKEVKVHRILVRETVEDRILALQEGKRKLVEAALDEGQLSNVGRLSENELRYLFGVQARPNRH
ncbi:SNF2 family N-terminal domain-containing protein [Lasiosphaeris hirsuta]|uniref:SNF2 family N-terminal domain-containing protein n=1 Tax=Lasiosphaeris hirsuta TaxID=260670 RepID=A0AA40B986_9PEZI|nr:SNF2 family N-terminal domain-containing protein [Lasiosphaeris hirsuta]